MSRRDVLDLTGRAILINGACGDLGRAIIARLIDHGATIVANDILDADAAADLLGSNPDIHYVRGDALTPEDADRIVRETTNLLGRSPDTVCCHAGMVSSHPVEDYPPDTFARIMATNVGANYNLAARAARQWRQQNEPGQLIFTSSWVSATPWPGIGPYSASKAAIEALTRSFARELAPHNIRANAIAPGIVAAGMALRQWNTEPDYKARASKAIPLGYLQPLESVANAFLFLASPLSQYMTGATLVVDGGASLYPMD